MQFRLQPLAPEPTAGPELLVRPLPEVDLLFIGPTVAADPQGVDVLTEVRSAQQI